MPIYWVSLNDGGWWVDAPAVLAWTTPSTSSTAGLNTITTSSTTSTYSNIIWPITTGSTMAMSVFDTPRYFLGAQAAQAQAALQQQLYDARPGGFVNVTRQQLGQLAQGQLGQLPPQRPSPEQLAAAERRMREDHDRAQQVARNRESAARRARDLLIEHLTPEQRETFVRHGWFVVEGGQSKTRYRIHTDRGPAGNIHELDITGNAVAQLCGHIRHMSLPLCDEVLAQMIMLKADEEGYRRLANRSRLR